MVVVNTFFLTPLPILKLVQTRFVFVKIHIFAGGLERDKNRSWRLAPHHRRLLFIILEQSKKILTIVNFFTDNTLNMIYDPESLTEFNLLRLLFLNRTSGCLKFCLPYVVDKDRVISSDYRVAVLLALVLLL